MSGSKEFHGVCFSVSNWPVTKSEYLPHLETVAPHTEWVRTYNDTMPEFGLESHRLGLKVAAGAALIAGLFARNDGEVARLIQDARNGHVDLAVIGNETIYSGGISPADHSIYIDRFRRACPHVPVTTAQDADRLMDHPEVIDGCDIVAMHVYPYWGGRHIDDACSHVAMKYERILDLAKGKEVQILETGWPTAGETIGEAIPSLENAAQYIVDVHEWALANNVKVWPFEALNEPWKAAIEKEQGAHWGIWDKDGVRKYLTW